MDNLVKEKKSTLNISRHKTSKIGGTMKRANLRVMQVEEGEETQEKSIENIFNKIIKENFPNLMLWELLQPIDFKIPTHFVCGPMHYKCR